MIPVAAQMAQVWHREGMFMGMHWAWWFFWIAAILIILWAFYRLVADREAAKREAARLREMEAVLRARHARGEIDDHELAHELMALLTAGTRHVTSV